MAELRDLLEYYQDEVFQNTLKGTLISGDFNWEGKPMIIQLEKLEPKQILFNLTQKPLRISLVEGDIRKDFELENSANFKYLFWITSKKDDKIGVSYLRCGNGQKFDAILDIGFGENIIHSYNKARLEKLPEYLARDFIFTTGESGFVFVQTYPNSTKNFILYGLEKRAEIREVDNKWIVQKISRKPFPKKHEDFIQLNVAQYKSVNFVESSKAKEAFETIKAEEAKGNTLIALWKVYSEIELDRARLLKDKVGELKFDKVKVLPEGITRIRINNLTEEVKSVLHENKDDILNTSLEIAPDSEQAQSKGKSEKFKIKAINTDYSFDLYDELNNMPAKGAFSVSLIGDEIVNKRRERALKSLREDRRFITRNLLFAIEGVSEAMLDKKRKEKALTERTRKFLKEKFGINDLTTNQKEAVEIAINTPDIAVIQGPPGTGKSTVVAAICDRLIEIAEKKSSIDKLILVSAFQNDTVEHIASKIYTLGLPTLKVGKEMHGNIRAEDRLIEDMRLRIDTSLQQLSVQGDAFRVSKKLQDILAVYKREKDDLATKAKITSLLKTTEVDHDLWATWKVISENMQYNEASADKNLTLLKGLRTEVASYNDDGYEKVIRVLKSDIPFTKEEKAFLEDSPLEDPSHEFLVRLKSIKEKHLEEIGSITNTLHTGNDLSLLDWLQNATSYFKRKEEVIYEDDETFLSANLEAFRDELNGNAEFVREAIKDYSESLAATNQVSGGKEMASYRSIENVILEEAARSNPLDLLIPMSKATERIILVGDQNQLPHLLEDDIADETSAKLVARFEQAETKKKLEESLFGVIFKNLSTAKPQRTITLTEQFRMHPFIGDFISKVYYNGALKPGMPTQSEIRRHNLQISWAKDKVAVFCDVPKGAGKEEMGKSKSRPAEAKRIVRLLEELKTDPNFENLSVGVITFYARQVDELFREAARKGFTEQKPDGTYAIAAQYKETKDGREKLRIGSVDSFQGKEFDIVILSTVRSNNIGRIHDNYKKVFGFLTLENRLNVAFSRSQSLLIVVGDGEMFSDDFAKSYVEGLSEFYITLSNDQRYGNRIQ